MFSLRALMVAVAVAAVCVAGFVYRTPLWASIVVALALVLLVCGLSAIYLLPNRRSFFIPAVVAGCVYGATAYLQPTSLVTDHLLFSWWYEGNTTAIAPMFQRATGKPIEKELAYAVLSGNAETVTLCLPHTMMISVVRIQVPLRSLQQIGHSAIAIGLAVIAGLIGSFVARRRDFNERPNHV